MNLHAWAIGHLQKCSSPAECFLEHSNGKKKKCAPKKLHETAWEMALGVRKRRDVCDAYPDSAYPRGFDLSAVSYTDTSCRSRDFSCLAPTELSWKQKEYTKCLLWKWNLICLQPLLHSLFCWHKRDSICCPLVSCHQQKHKAQYCLGFLTVSQKSTNVLRGFISE